MKQTTDKPRGFVFYTQDYFGAVDVRSMPYDLRIVWVEIFLLMDQSPSRGTLLKKNGEPYTKEGLAKIINCPLDVVEKAWDWVVKEQIADVAPKLGTLINRRMKREEKRLEILRNNGKKGGNPSLVSQSKHKSKTALDNQPVNTLDNSARARTDPDPDPEPDPFPILKHSPILPNSSARIEQTADRTGDEKTSAPRNGNGSRGRESQATGPMLVKIWAPFAKELRNSVTADTYEKFYAGARIVELGGATVTLAVQKRWIEKEGDETSVALHVLTIAKRIGVDLARDRQLKIVSIESVIAEGLK